MVGSIFDASDVKLLFEIIFLPIWGGYFFVLFLCVVNLDVGKFGPHPVVGYGCQGGLSF